MTRAESFAQLKTDVGWAKHFRAFRLYHLANPTVYGYFERFAREVAAAGHARYGAHAIVQRIRWELAITTKSADGFKISNCHFPFYARLFAIRNPEYAGLFVTRELR